MKKMISVFALLLIFFLAAVPAAVAEETSYYNPEFCVGKWCPNNGPQWFGPAYSGMSGFGDWKVNIPSVAEFSNLVMIGQLIGLTDPAEIAGNDVEEITLASQCGAKYLLVLFNIFFEAVYDGDRLVDMVLRPDYGARWAEYAQIIESHSENIYGIITVDEPYLNSILVGKSIMEMRNELNQVNFLIKKTFPAVRTVCIMHTTYNNLTQEYFYGIPVPKEAAAEYGLPLCDVIGFDYYYSSNLEMSLEGFKQAWLEKFDDLNKFLLPGQEILLVPGTFYFKDARSPTVIEFLNLADFYSKIAKSNSQVTAIMPFLWETVGNNLIGMRNLPRKVLFRWQEIGRKISR